MQSPPDDNILHSYEPENAEKLLPTIYWHIFSTKRICTHIPPPVACTWKELCEVYNDYYYYYYCSTVYSTEFYVQML